MTALAWLLWAAGVAVAYVALALLLASVCGVGRDGDAVQSKLLSKLLRRSDG